jgi:hypothetical protein
MPPPPPPQQQAYIHPNLRNRPAAETVPKKLVFRPVIDYTNLKTKDQLYEEYRQKNMGKADSGWGDED